MSRNDSSLYTGMTSQSFGTVKTHSVRKSLSEEKQEKRQKLIPELAVLVEFIESERRIQLESIAKLPMRLETPEISVKEELRAYQRNQAFIDGFALRLANVMRKGKV